MKVMMIANGQIGDKDYIKGREEDLSPKDYDLLKLSCMPLDEYKKMMKKSSNKMMRGALTK